MLLSQPPGSSGSDKMIRAMAGKWELTFTTLVVFGGAFFASFPLFYSTSFGGAYWLWMCILVSFVLQAVSYEFRARRGNLFGAKTYDVFLFLNGCVGCILLGVAVSMMFFGAEFEVNRGSLLETGSPVISTWVPTHGWEAIFNWKNLILGVAILFLARMQAALYFQNLYRDNDAFFHRNKIRVWLNGAVFVAFFVWFLVMLLVSPGLQTQPDGSFILRPYKFFYNYVEMWWCIPMLLIGVIMVVIAILGGGLGRHCTNGIWWSGIGSSLVVLSLFFVAGYNNTPYYPSLISPNSSLTIFNSSSTKFTLEVMSYVSILVPIVLFYIIVVWKKLSRN